MSSQPSPTPVSTQVVGEECCPPLLAAPLDAAHAGEIANAFRALADPVRVRLVSLIAAHGEVCVCDLTGNFAQSAPTISHHLKVLREAGLVECERRGTWVYYRASRPRLRWLSALLDAAEYH